MDSQEKKIYLSYKGYSKSVSDLISIPAPQEKERKKIYQMIHPCLQFLKDSFVNEIQAYVTLLQKFGFNAKTIFNLFMDFGSFEKITCITKRSFNKANFEEKNIVINRIIIEYEDQFIDFLSNYYRPNLPFVTNFDSFIQEFKDTIQKTKCCSILSEESDMDQLISDPESPLDDYYENEQFGFFLL